TGKPALPEIVQVRAEMARHVLKAGEPVAGQWAAQVVQLGAHVADQVRAGLSLRAGGEDGSCPRPTERVRQLPGETGCEAALPLADQRAEDRLVRQLLGKAAQVRGH